MFTKVSRCGLIALTLGASTSAFAQLQTNQLFNSQGPAPSFGPTQSGGNDVIQSGDAPPNGTVVGAVQAIVADPGNANRFFVGTVNGGVFETTNGGTTWTALTDKQASLSIASLAFDPTDATRQTLIAGTGLVANGTPCSGGSCFFTSTGGLRNGLLYSTNGGTTWTALNNGLPGQTVVDVAARGNVIMAATFETSFAALGAGQTTTGGLYRSTNGGASFTQVAPGSGLGNGPVTSLVGDPANNATFYAAVTAPTANAAGFQSTAIYRSTDSGATWTQIFNSTNSGGTITNTKQTAIRLASGPGGTVAIALYDVVANVNGPPFVANNVLR